MNNNPPGGANQSGEGRKKPFFFPIFSFPVVVIVVGNNPDGK